MRKLAPKAALNRGLYRRLIHEAQKNPLRVSPSVISYCKKAVGCSIGLK
jgi:hypothetical protein